MKAYEPAPRDVAEPVRQILKPWSPVCVRDFPSTEKGLTELAYLTLMLVIRNKTFLKALGEISSPNIEHEVSEFMDAHQALVANLSMLRSGQVSVTDISELVPTIQLASDDFTARRSSIFERLDFEQTRRLTSGELSVEVFVSELANEMDHAAQLIWASIDEALDSDWLESNFSFAVAE